MNPPAQTAAQPTPAIPPLYTIKKFADKITPYGLTENSLRWMIFNCEANGLAKSDAILRIGRRILINEQKFFAWLLTNRPPTQRRRAA